MATTDEPSTGQQNENNPSLQSGGASSFGGASGGGPSGGATAAPSVAPSSSGPPPGASGGYGGASAPSTQPPSATGGVPVTPPPTASGGTPAISSGGASSVPPPGTGGTTSVMPPPNSKCTFTFDVTTVTAHGFYGPKNVGAIWITDANKKFVKTLAAWGKQRLYNATSWENASGGNVVDVVTGATRQTHGPLTAKWDCTDTSHNVVADGMYTVSITFAEAESLFTMPPAASMQFTKSPTGADAMGQDTTNFTGMHVHLTIP